MGREQENHRGGSWSLCVNAKPLPCQASPLGAVGADRPTPANFRVKGRGKGNADHSSPQSAGPCTQYMGHLIKDLYGGHWVDRTVKPDL